MSDCVPVLDYIPLPSTQISQSFSGKSGSQNIPHSSKRKPSKHDDSDEEKDDHSKKKHKKAKKKDKHKDKYKDREKHKDREKSKDKKKEKKHSNEPELTAIEKFNMFKKQREGGKGEDKIVDDLFKDFIATKLKQIESDGIKEKKSKSKDKDKTVNSVDEMNRFLDDEINNIALPPVSFDKMKLPDRLKSVDKAMLPPDRLKSPEMVQIDKIKHSDITKPVPAPDKLSVFDHPTKLGSLLKMDKRKEKMAFGNLAGIIKRPIAEFELPLRKEKDVTKTSQTKPQVFSDSAIPLLSGSNPQLKVPRSNAHDNPTNSNQDETVKSVFGPMLPRAVVISGEKRDNTEEQKAEVKKPIGFKNFGIKLSAISAELIQSGELHKRGKRLEEGEVLSSSSEGSDSSDTEADADDNDNANEVSGTGSLSDSDEDLKSDSKSKKKKKKKKKGKHKKKKKHKEKDKAKDNDDVLGGKEKSGNKRKVSITPRSGSRSPKKSRKSRSRSRSRDRSKRKSRSRSRDRGRSHRSRSRSRGKRSRSRGRRSRSRGRRSRSRSRRSRSRSRRSRSKGRRSRSKSRSPDRFWRSKYGDFDAYRFLKGKRERSRSRSPDRERDRFIEKEKKRLEDLRLRIDKTKLREIAIKNAVSNARSGGPQLDVTIKSGGKSVEELTEYCKKIQEKEITKKKLRNDLDSSSDEEPSRNSDEEDMLHHPFLVKEAGAIIVDIKNSRQLPLISPQERIVQTSQLRITYPVSSGSQHRDKEWVPVEPVPTNQPKSNLVGGVPALMPPPPAPPKPKPEVKVFEETAGLPVDIGSIVSERLTAMKKLQDNPFDVSAKIILSKAQKQASQWAQSKNLPGQFIGSTGANIMSQEELMGNKKRQAWCKKVYKVTSLLDDLHTARRC